MEWGDIGIEIAKVVFDSDMVKFAEVISKGVVMRIIRMQANTCASTVPV